MGPQIFEHQLAIYLKPGLHVRLVSLSGIQGFRGNPFDGGRERAIEGQELSQVRGSGRVTRSISAGDYGTLKSVRQTFEIRCRWWGVTGYAIRQGLQGGRHCFTESELCCPNYIRVCPVLSPASEREQQYEDDLRLTRKLLDLT